ncbi:exonuclease [Peptoniphilus sp. AGMB00490]|uniref:Exonuclease n=1 Tax=Peptoniphilus faecalis TaxID=2731255 RepID=A0A848RF54_9FIRM|nr:exonuclease domain-containing protein [Peptoniphilus faecalis]MDD6906311.1 exonuclease domain-containing protein [Finegoldia magna]NMW85450.1 exonuclease [Peptoniphilus faecalis]
MFIIESGMLKHAIRNKGKSLNEFPTDFCVLDLETTGLNPLFDEIIEIGILKIKNNRIIDSFESLIQPKEYNYSDDDGNRISYYIDDFIEELTGITNEMLKTAPKLEEVFDHVIEFIGENIIVGHNVNFDINFIYDFYEQNYEKEFNNDYWDLLKLSRRILKNLEHHRLKDLAEYFNYNYEGHRAVNDCKTTLKIMNLLKEYAEKNNINYLTLPSEDVDLRKIKSTEDDIDPENYFYNKNICFTGKLEHFTRKEAAQICVNLGASCENSVTKKTNILVLGSFDYNATVKDKSIKLKKAEKLILDGQDLQIMDESLFLDTIK